MPQVSFSRAVLYVLVLCILPALARAQSVLEPAEWCQMGSFDEPINSIYFLPSTSDPSVGFVGTGDFERGHGEIYRTTDSGHSWHATTLPAGAAESVTDIVFKDNLTGWATTSTANSPAGAVYRTSDGGESWARTSATNSVYLGLAYSATSQLLFVGRGGAEPLVSSDGGDSWQPLLDGVVTSFGFVDDSIGFASGAHRFMPNGATFAVTTDGGRTWRSTALNAECYQPLMLPRTHEIYALNEGTGQLYYSSDLGISWDTIHTFVSPESWMTGCVRGNACGRLYAQTSYGTKSGLVVSDDKGRSWTALRATPIYAPLTNAIDTRFWEDKDVVYVARQSTTSIGNTLYRYRRTHASGTSNEAPFSTARTVTLTSPGCEYADTTLAIAYPNDCALATLVSVRFADSVHFQLIGETVPKRLQNVTPLHIAYVPEDDRPVSSFILLQYQIGDATFLDTVKVNGSVDASRTLSRLSLSARSRALPPIAGDTIEVQVSLRDVLDVNSGLDSVSFALDFPKDMFSVVDAAGASGWQIGSCYLRDQCRMTLLPPMHDCPQDEVIAMVRLRVMLSVDSTADLGLDGISWNGQNFEGCSMTERSLKTVYVSRSRSCGDGLLQNFLQTGSLLTVEIDGLERTLDASIATSLDGQSQIAVVNELGEAVTRDVVALKKGMNQISIAKPTMSGAYYLVVEFNGEKRIRPFMIQ